MINCYQELTGFGYYFWFIFDGTRIKNHPIDDEISFDFSQISELNFLVESITEIRLDEAYQGILRNYCRRIIKPRFFSIKSMIRLDMTPPLEYKYEVYNNIEKLVAFLKITGEVEEVIDFLYEELVEESTFSWFDIEDSLIVDLRASQKVGIEMVSVLTELGSLSKRFTPARIIPIILANRLSDLHKEYNENFSRIKKYNYYEGDVLRLVEIIETLVHYYRVSGDRMYLKIPYEELVEGTGKIRWATFGFRVNSWVPFRCEFGKIRARRLIRTISHFKFFYVRNYVLVEYEKRLIIGTAANTA